MDGLLLNYIIISFFAAGLGLVWDHFCVKMGFEEQVRIGWLVPLGEEVIKLTLAVVNWMPVYAVSGLYGLWEGFYEAIRDKRVRALKHIGAGILTHLLFGAVYFLPIPLWLRFIGAFLLHAAWNQYILMINYR